MTDPNKIDEYTEKVRLYQCLTAHWTYIGFVTKVVSAHDVADIIHAHSRQIQAHIETLAGEIERMRNEIFPEDNPSGGNHDRSE